MCVCMVCVYGVCVCVCVFMVVCVVCMVCVCVCVYGVCMVCEREEQEKTVTFLVTSLFSIIEE